MAMSLGLGRLHRRALGPLVKHLIELPYDRQLSAQYRQARLSFAEYIRGYQADDGNTRGFDKNFAEFGYRDDEIALALALMRKKIAPRELNTLLRFGELDQTQVESEYLDDGVARRTAQKIIRAQELERLDALEQHYASELLSLYKEGKITLDEYQGELDTLHLPEEELKLWDRRARVVKTPGTKHL